MSGAITWEAVMNAENIKSEISLNPYTVSVSSDGFIDNQIYVYVVISKLYPLSDISVFSDDKNVNDILLRINEEQYKIMKLPIIQSV